MSRRQNQYEEEDLEGDEEEEIEQGGEEEEVVEEDGEEVEVEIEEGEEVEEEVEDPDQEDVGGPTVQDRLKSLGTNNEELHRAATTLTKGMMANISNNYAATDPKDHTDVDHDDIELHEHGDWRVQDFVTADHEGNVFHLQAKIDTGADGNMVRADVIDVHGLGDMVSIEEGPGVYTAGDGQDTSSLGKITIPFISGLDHERYEQEFEVMPDLQQDILLGWPFLQMSHQLIIAPAIDLDDADVYPPDENGKKSLLIMELAKSDSNKQAQWEQWRKQRQAEKQASRTTR